MMRASVLFLTIVFIHLSWAKVAQEEGLPWEPDTTLIKNSNIAIGKQITLDFFMSLPASQKLNKGTNSFVGIYEKVNKQKWTQTYMQSLDVLPMKSYGSASQTAENDELEFSQKINLKNPDSEIAVYATVYHCGKDGKSTCYIQAFLSKIKRDKKLSPNAMYVPFLINPKVK